MRHFIPKAPGKPVLCGRPRVGDKHATASEGKLVTTSEQPAPEGDDQLSQKTDKPENDSATQAEQDEDTPGSD